MISHYEPADGALRRHDLAFVAPSAWRCALAMRPDLGQEPLVAEWAGCGRPLIVRRGTPCEPAGVPLGLPLPPSHGRQRLAFLLSRDTVSATSPPPLLRAAIDAAPAAWRPTLRRLAALAPDFGGPARVHGSLAWQLLTGLDYLTERSDLDVLLPLPPACEVSRLVREIAALESMAPMRIDGELLRDDGAGVNWRELAGGTREVLVKTSRDVVLLPVDRFLAAEGCR